MDLKKYAPATIRIGLGLCFFVFAIDQFVRPDYWLGYIPSWVLGFGISDTTLIMMNATFDLIIGLMLITGLFVRVFAALATLHLIGIAASLGYNDIAVRDVALAIVAIGVFAQGADTYTIDAVWRKENK